MSDSKLKFGDKEVSKREFDGNKKPVQIDNIDVNKIMVPEKNCIIKK